MPYRIKAKEFTDLSKVVVAELLFPCQLTVKEYYKLDLQRNHTMFVAVKETGKQGGAGTADTNNKSVANM
jgi:hypothetical protein